MPFFLLQRKKKDDTKNISLFVEKNAQSFKRYTQTWNTASKDLLFYWSKPGHVLGEMKFCKEFFCLKKISNFSYQLFIYCYLKYFSDHFFFFRIIHVSFQQNSFLMIGIMTNNFFLFCIDRELEIKIKL